ncbi:MAG: hypothetical protein GXY74_02225 [Phycisphaerae bacterium]|nr:hypothetical protein [Phycisphaerae bacterium]
MGAYIVGMIVGTVCIVSSLCYLGAQGHLEVELAIGAAVVGGLVLIVSTVLTAYAARGPKAPKPAKAGPAEPAPAPQPADDEIELPGIDES